MSSTFCRVDVVDEREDALDIALVVLESHFYFEILLFALNINWLFVEDIFVLIEMLNERSHSTFVTEFSELVVPVISNGDVDSSVEKGQFTQAL